jgi:hypothetical protein
LHEEERLSAVTQSIIHGSCSDVVGIWVGDDARSLPVAGGSQELLESSEVVGLRAIILEVRGGVLTEVELIVIL